MVRIVRSMNELNPTEPARCSFFERSNPRSHEIRQLAHARPPESAVPRCESEPSLAGPTSRATPPFDKIIGHSRVLCELLEQVSMVGPTDTTVLILGESGTGKELVAEAIHDISSRRNRPLVRVNCGSIPSELFESEFFGHAKGAFTGALRDRTGRFQHANGGTLFLDEVGEIPPAHQSKLLRVLQVGQFERVGEETTRQVDVRIIAATNRDLQQEVRSGRFRQDLYYRLCVFPLLVPPLRERREDIPDLANHFVSLFRNRLNRLDLRLTNTDIEVLGRHDWAGNIRELQNAIERAMILAKESRLRFDLGSPSLIAQNQDPVVIEGMTKRSSTAEILTSESLRQLERDSILAALQQTRGKISGPAGAAELLGLNANTLTYRIRALGIGRLRSQSRPSESLGRSATRSCLNANRLPGVP
ncbi:MAG: sigma-54-dependent Fis family transcriptional regulator [Deltaproteobacteria bacterium]|nr:sigma-54-dependent Fis family transcriptional regulator [Deltaproteobacteria bacterium]